MNGRGPNKKTKPSPFRPGQVIGSRTLERRFMGHNSLWYWFTKCACGREGVAREYSLIHGIATHCRDCNPGRKPKKCRVPVGTTINWWTLVEPVASARIIRPNGRKGRGHRHVRVRCRCGALRIMRETQFINGRSKSCGCGRGYFSSLGNRITAERKWNESRVTSTGSTTIPTPGPVLRAEGIREGLVGVDSLP